MVKKVNAKEMKKLEEIFLKTAEKLSDSDKFLFQKRLSLFYGYINILENLSKSLFIEDGIIVEKEYVKGRPSVTVNPAVGQYNSTSKQLDSVISSIEKMLDKVQDVNTDTMPSILKKRQEKSKE